MSFCSTEDWISVETNCKFSLSGTILGGKKCATKGKCLTKGVSKLSYLGVSTVYW